MLPCLQVVNVTVLAIESERPDPRLEAWEGQTLSFFFNNGNSSASDGTVAPADVHAAVSHLDFCPVAGGNVLNITVRRLGPACAAPAATGCRWPPPFNHACPNHCCPAQARLDAETTFEGAPVRGDLLPGTVVEVLVGQHDVMEQRGHEWHLIAHLGDSAAAAPDATCSA